MLPSELWMPLKLLVSFKGVIVCYLTVKQKLCESKNPIVVVSGVATPYLGGGAQSPPLKSDYRFFRAWYGCRVADLVGRVKGFQLVTALTASV
jgi:hypothetical protein